MGPITPFGDVACQHQTVMAECFISGMNEAANFRVERLERWIRKHRKDLLAEDGEAVSSVKLSAVTSKQPSYWSDVLRGRKSFGDKAAREVETALSMPQLHLEGATWPFDEVDQDRFERLSQRQKGRVEQALIEILEKIESGESKTVERAA